MWRFASLSRTHPNLNFFSLIHFFNGFWHRIQQSIQIQTQTRLFHHTLIQLCCWVTKGAMRERKTGINVIRIAQSLETKQDTNDRKRTRSDYQQGPSSKGNTSSLDVDGCVLHPAKNQYHENDSRDQNIPRRVHHSRQADSCMWLQCLKWGYSRGLLSRGHRPS